jgi:flagellar biosynthesis protein FliQ
MNVFVFFAFSSVIHLLYLFLDLFEEKQLKSSPNYIIEKNIEEQKKIFGDYVNEFYEYLFIICSFIVAWYSISFTYHEYLTSGIYGRLDALSQFLSSPLLLIGIAFGILVDYVESKLKLKWLNLSYVFYLVFALLSLYLLSDIGITLLGYLLTKLIIDIPKRNHKLIIFLLWVFGLLNIAGFYLFFDFPITLGLFGQGIRYDVQLFSIIILCIFAVGILLSLLMANIIKKKEELK